MKSTSLFHSIFTVLLFCFAMFSLFGCFRKKTVRNNVEIWLEAKFPGRFEVLQSNINVLDVMAYYYGKKVALIADKADPEVQIVLNWQKDVTDLGLTTEQVQTAHECAQLGVGQARKLFKVLKDQGLEKLSVGVMDQAAYLLVFAEPTAVVREQTLAAILAVWNAQASPQQTSVFVEMMEDTAYHQQFQDIIPNGHWKVPTGWQEREKIMAIDFEWKKGLAVATLMPGWEINTEAKRSSEYREMAYQAALPWAEKHLAKPFYLEPVQMVAYELDSKDGLAVHFHFPYYNAKPTDADSTTTTEPKGYVSGLYRIEDKTFTKIKQQQAL